MSKIVRLVQSGLWRWLKGTGLERFELLRTTDGYTLRGIIVALAEGKSAEAAYAVVCDQSWRTRTADVSVRDENGKRDLRLAVQNGLWYVEGKENNEVAGCTDVDLEWSPSTNTLPIRRLRLAVGQRSGPVSAAWVRFPSLTLERLPQEYERVSEARYRYRSGGGTFVAEIVVDEDGLVRNYEGLWERAVNNGRNTR